MTIFTADAPKGGIIDASSPEDVAEDQSSEVVGLPDGFVWPDGLTWPDGEAETDGAESDAQDDAKDDVVEAIGATPTNKAMGDRPVTPVVVETIVIS